jgi:alpha-D-ribose 1-methylphosphonate 5-triphosphate synthase subunit PhnH
MNVGIEMEQINPGFIDPVFDAQQSFRTIMEAMIHPGQDMSISTDISPPPPINVASAAVCLTLLDFETALWTDLSEINNVVGWLCFHCGCKIVSHTSEATFALITDACSLPPLDQFRLGSDECPDMSTTLIVQVDSFSRSKGKRLIGPGIRTSKNLRIKGIREEFWSHWQAQQKIFPLGVDVIFTCGNALTALPRSTRIEG